MANMQGNNGIPDVATVPDNTNPIDLGDGEGIFLGDIFVDEHLVPPSVEIAMAHIAVNPPNVMVDQMMALPADFDFMANDFPIEPDTFAAFMSAIEAMSNNNNNAVDVKMEFAADEQLPQQVPEIQSAHFQLSVQDQEAILLHMFSRPIIYQWTTATARQYRNLYPDLAAGIKSLRRRESTRLASIRHRAMRRAELSRLQGLAAH
jgi:hypothetical protein